MAVKLSLAEGIRYTVELDRRERGSMLWLAG
jgi:hypothetical protein